MGVQSARKPPGILDDLYGVQLGHRTPQIQRNDEGVRTSFGDSSTCEEPNGRRTATKQQQRLLIRRLWQQRPSCLKPIHCSITCMAASIPSIQKPVPRYLSVKWSFLADTFISAGDKHGGETIANVVTSLPFIVLGLQTPRQDKTPEKRCFFVLFFLILNLIRDQCCRKNLKTAIYANSLVGVGIASGLYHSSKGEVRKFLRWADYTMIATTTLVSRILIEQLLNHQNWQLMVNIHTCFLCSVYPGQLGMRTQDY